MFVLTITVYLTLHSQSSINQIFNTKQLQDFHWQRIHIKHIYCHFRYFTMPITIKDCSLLLHHFVLLYSQTSLHLCPSLYDISAFIVHHKFIARFAYTTIYLHLISCQLTTMMQMHFYSLYISAKHVLFSSSPSLLTVLNILNLLYSSSL